MTVKQALFVGAALGAGAVGTGKYAVDSANASARNEGCFVAQPDGGITIRLVGEVDGKAADFYADGCSISCGGKAPADVAKPHK